MRIEVAKLGRENVRLLSALSVMDEEGLAALET